MRQNHKGLFAWCSGTLMCSCRQICCASSSLDPHADLWWVMRWHCQESVAHVQMQKERLRITYLRGHVSHSLYILQNIHILFSCAPLLERTKQHHVHYDQTRVKMVNGNSEGRAQVEEDYHNLAQNLSLNFLAGFTRFHGHGHLAREAWLFSKRYKCLLQH